MMTIVPDLKELIGPFVIFVDLIMAVSGLLVIVAVGNRIGCIWRLIGLVACLAIIFSMVVDIYNMTIPTNVDFFQSFINGG